MCRNPPPHDTPGDRGVPSGGYSMTIPSFPLLTTTGSRTPVRTQPPRALSSLRGPGPTGRSPPSSRTPYSGLYPAGDPFERLRFHLERKARRLEQVLLQQGELHVSHFPDILPAKGRKRSDRLSGSETLGGNAAVPCPAPLRPRLLILRVKPDFLSDADVSRHHEDGVPRIGGTALASVIFPSSNNCRNRSNTRGDALSISSRRTTEYGVVRSLPVSCPPSS